MINILAGAALATMGHLVVSYLLNARRARQVSAMLATYDAWVHSTECGDSMLRHWSWFRDVLEASGIPNSAVPISKDKDLTALEVFGARNAEGNGTAVIATVIMRSLTQAESVFKGRRHPLEFFSFWAKSFHQDLSAVLGVASIVASLCSALQAGQG